GTSHFGLARINSDGSLDPSFNSSIGGGSSIVVQPDGKVLANSGSNIARLNPDGSLASSFNPGSGTRYGIKSVALQADGKIIIGGEFDTWGDPHKFLVRLNSNGSLDASFNVDVNGYVYSV